MTERLSDSPVPRPIAVILRNRQALAERAGPEHALYTPAAGKHYWGDYLWDGAAAAVIASHFGYPRLAETEIFSLFRGQRPNGLVPNMQPPDGKSRRYDPAVLTYMHPEVGSDYTQPPIVATAVEATYRALQSEDPAKASLFLQEVYPKLKLSISYFEKHRQLSPSNPLIFNIHPHETGRDSDPTLRHGLIPKIPRRGKETLRAVDIANTGLDYLGVMALSARNRLNDWDPAKIHDYYKPVDLMFNSLYVSNTRVLAGLADELTETVDAEHFRDLADHVEHRIKTDMWFPDARAGDGAFLGLSKDGPVEDISISNLGVVQLRNLDEPQLESVLKMMYKSFNTKFSLPSVATDSRHYDPAGQQPHLLWDAEVMIIADWIEANGLRLQSSRPELSQRPDLVRACSYWAEQRIVPSSKALVEQGYFEGYNPETGQPRRTGLVHDFTWDGLAEIM